MRVNPSMEWLSGLPDFGASTLRLDDYLAACGKATWRWGVMDCCQFAGRWVEGRTGRDPLADFRYGSAKDALRILSKSGGLPNAVDRGMTSIGMRRTDAPDFGDIGVIETRGDVQNIAGAAVAIFNGVYWIGKQPDGLAYVKAKSLISWRVA
jgi:hypothetical protein